MRALFFLSSLLSVVPSVSPYNFLVFCPLFGHSHTTFFAKIADTLADGGHNVTFFTPTIVTKYSKINYLRSAQKVIHLEPSEKLAELGDSFEDKDFFRFWSDDFSFNEAFTMIKLFNDMFMEQANVLHDNMELLDELKAQKFDVMVFEGFVKCAYPLLDYLEIATYLPSTSLAFDINLGQAIGEPFQSSFVPLPLSQFSDRMSLFERLTNTMMPLIFPFLVQSPRFKSFRAPFNLIDIDSIQSEAPFVFTNSNPYIEFPKATITKTVQIGGVSVDVNILKSQKVDGEWDRVLNLRCKTVLVSFGSVMLSKDMPIGYKKSLAAAMKEHKEVTFIWKYEANDTNTFAAGIENIYFSKWIPQTALLADSRLSAFLTHGGLGSVNEVSYLGKPTIMCPVFADQMRNAKMLARHNGSIEISKYDLENTEKIYDAFQRILFDESYKNAAKTLALQLEHQPTTPRELMLKHAEFAAQFGRLPSLDPYSRKMSFLEYFLLDVISIVISTLLLISYAFYRLLKLMISCILFTCPIRKRKVD